MAILNMRSVVFLVLCLVSWVVAVDDFSKRLLLNDQDAVTRLASMEKTIQQLTQSLAKMESESKQKTDLLTQSLTEAKTKTNLLEQSIVNLEAESKTKAASLEQSLSKVQTELNAKTSLLEQMKLGSTYIRWGRKQCIADQTETVYSGFTAGQKYTYGSYYGGPSNYLCLPNNPDISNRTAPGNSAIYGSEFQDGDFFAQGAQDEDIPCALCKSINTSVTVMIPGKETCYGGWKKEYVGLLSSGDRAYKASSYICMDRHPEYLQGGERNNDENLIYATTTKCGSLPCPPYVNGRAVNCVVCSI